MAFIGFTRLDADVLRARGTAGYDAALRRWGR